MVNLCLTLAESSAVVLREKISHYTGQVPYLEVRFDYLDVIEVPKVFNHQGTQFIATCRPEREGGNYKGTEVDRIDLLQKAAHSGFHWLDLEHDVTSIKNLPSTTQVIRSYHCFGDSCANLENYFQTLKNAGGDVLKLAISIRTTKELIELLEWMPSIPKEIPFVILGMGIFGQVSRLLGGFLGNRWTYVAEKIENSVAPGQFTLKQAQDWYRLSGWESPPPIFGVLGNPVEHSLSPLIHNRLFKHFGVTSIYLPFLIDQIDLWLRYVRTSPLDFRGFSVTLPFKTDALKLVETSTSPVNSINTLTRKGSSWEGSNTDYAAFLYPLQSRFSLEGKTALVLGNGGVAHTVVRALQNEGLSVTVAGRNCEKVSKFASRYGCSWTSLSNLPTKVDFCINTTPVGQHPNTDKSLLQARDMKFDVVYDLIYRPEKTLLLRSANQLGLQTISGMEMFVEQAARQFQDWTGLSPDREMIKDIINETLCLSVGKSQLKTAASKTQ